MVKKLPLMSTGPCFYSAEEICYASIHSAASYIRYIFFPKTNSLITRTRTMQRESRTWLHGPPLRNLPPLFFFSSLFLCNLCPHLLLTGTTSGNGGDCLAELRGTSSFMLLTRSINCWICAETPAMLQHSCRWAWPPALLAQCVCTIARLPAPMPMP